MIAPSDGLERRRRHAHQHWYGCVRRGVGRRERNGAGGEECGGGERDESLEEAERGDIDNNRHEWIVTWRGQRMVGFRMED